mmetsp:Transcript_1444/g.2199  ORF Transcript_1444/g.2199 Transcript_1444/m.2199 type:complete len:136 (-) Transcript_1444:859-1266(-)
MPSIPPPVRPTTHLLCIAWMDVLSLRCVSFPGQCRKALCICVSHAHAPSPSLSQTSPFPFPFPLPALPCPAPASTCFFDDCACHVMSCHVMLDQQGKIPLGQRCHNAAMPDQIKASQMHVWLAAQLSSAHGSEAR